VVSPSKNRHGPISKLVVIVGGLLVARVASAEPPHLEAPADLGCPSAGELRGAIARQLGRDDFDRSDSPSVFVHVRRSSDGSLSADVSVTTTMTSSRTIDNADTCADLVRAAALSVALAIEKDAAEPKRPSLAPAPQEPTAPRIEPPIRSDRLAFTAASLSSLGLLPRPAQGAGVGVRARISDAIWISGRGFWLPGATMPNDAFSLRLFGAGAGACVEPFGSAAVAAVGCGHLVAGSFEVVDHSLPMKSREPEIYLAATLSAGARARVYGPVHLEVALDAHVPFGAPTYVTTACPPTGFEPPFMALALWLGAGASIR
jgi:hypothetical protein